MPPNATGSWRLILASSGTVAPTAAAQASPGLLRLVTSSVTFSTARTTRFHQKLPTAMTTLARLNGAPTNQLVFVVQVCRISAWAVPPHLDAVQTSTSGR